MTDKIIIDGVNVSECVNFRDDVYTDKYINNACSIGLWQRHYKNLEDSCKMFCECKNNPNCHYKQLQREKQKVWELEGRMKYIRQENITLKELATEEQVDFLALKNYANTLEFKERKFDKYKQALEEIKGNLKVNIEQTNKYPLKTNLEKILQKCEVLEDE